MNLNEKTFKENFAILTENFGFNISEAYLKMVFRALKENISDEQMTKITNKILLEVTTQEWSKKYGYNGKPVIADWLQFFTGKVKTSPEKQASLEVSRILDYAKYYLGHDVMFDNPYTNACVKQYGGIKTIAWDIDDTNNNKRPKEWLVKELKEIWLACFEGKKEDNTPCLGRTPSRIYSNGQFIQRERDLHYVGDKQKCLQLMDDSKSHEKSKLRLTA